MSLRAYLDLETTGRRSPGSHIIEVGAIVHDKDGREIDAYGSLANPGEDGIRTANPEAMAVNGITAEMLRSAPPADDIAKRLKAFLDNHWGATLHAFNNGFDLWFLARPPWAVPSQKWGECVMLAAAEIMAKHGALPKAPHLNKPKWPRLDEAARFFRVPRENSHQALDDARTAALVHREILIRRAEEGAESEVEYLLDSGL